MTLIYSTRERKKDTNLYNQLKIGNVNVDQVSCVKYLCLELDDKLNWNAHFKSVCNIIKHVKYVGSFKIIKGHVPDLQTAALLCIYML